MPVNSSISLSLRENHEELLKSINVDYSTSTVKLELHSVDDVLWPMVDHEEEIVIYLQYAFSSEMNLSMLAD